MRTEQQTKLCKPRQKMRVKVGTPYNRFKSSLIITAVSLLFHLLHVRCYSILCFHFIFYVCPKCLVSIFLFGKSGELGLSPVIFMFVNMCLSVCPFEVSDRLWIQI